MGNPKISIIVPIYMAEQFLRRTLDCIIAQSCADWECLLIDDGSRDNSGKICDEYATTDSRIKVFHKANGGVCSARNVGLNNAVGEYIAFIDADDVLNPMWLEEMYQNIKDTDLIVTGFIQHEENGDTEIKEAPNGVYHKDNYGYSDICSELLLQEQMGFLWTMLFRKSIIADNNLRFREGMISMEDLEFILRYLLHTNSFTTLNVQNYHYYLVKKSRRSTTAEKRLILTSMMKVVNGNVDELVKPYGSGVLQSLRSYSPSVGDIKEAKQFFYDFGGSYEKTSTSDFVYKTIMNKPLIISAITMQLYYYCRKFLALFNDKYKN